MDARKVAQEVRLAQWAEKIREQKNSGLNIRAWCADQGIARQQYFYWQKKLRELACQELLRDATEETDAEQRVVPSGWAVCKAEEETQKAITIEIGRCRVLAEPDVDPEWLAKVCRVLVSLC